MRYATLLTATAAAMASAQHGALQPELERSGPLHRLSSMATNHMVALEIEESSSAALQAVLSEQSLMWQTMHRKSTKKICNYFLKMKTTSDDVEEHCNGIADHFNIEEPFRKMDVKAKCLEEGKVWGKLAAASETPLTCSKAVRRQLRAVKSKHAKSLPQPDAFGMNLIQILIGLSMEGLDVTAEGVSALHGEDSIDTWAPWTCHLQAQVFFKALTGKAGKSTGSDNPSFDTVQSWVNAMGTDNKVYYLELMPKEASDACGQGHVFVIERKNGQAVLIQAYSYRPGNIAYSVDDWLDGATGSRFGSTNPVAWTDLRDELLKLGGDGADDAFNTLFSCPVSDFEFETGSVKSASFSSGFPEFKKLIGAAMALEDLDEKDDE